MYPVSIAGGRVALREFTHDDVEYLGLHRLWGARSPANTTSAQVMIKLGMIEEGSIRGHIRIRGTWRDSVVHSVLEDEWKAAPPNA